jgi:hypothetical protein
MILIYLTLAGGARGSEFVRWTVRNTNVQRSLFIYGGMAGFLSLYYKGRYSIIASKVNANKKYPRFVPTSVGEIMPRYLAFVRPVYIRVTRVLFDDDKKFERMRALLDTCFALSTEAVGGTKFCRALAKVTMSYSTLADPY